MWSTNYNLLTVRSRAVEPHHPLSSRAELQLRGGGGGGVTGNYTGIVETTQAGGRGEGGRNV